MRDILSLLELWHYCIRTNNFGNMKLLSKVRKIKREKGLSSFQTVIDSKFGLGKVECLLNINWFNPFLTIWLNFRSLPLKKAVFLPVWVYGRPRIYSLSGNIEIVGKIKSGMIKFNVSIPGGPSLGSFQSELFNLGMIRFNGRGRIGAGTKIFVSYNGILKIGNNFNITNMVNIGCMESIEIGAQLSLTHRCQIFDSNYHYIGDFKRRFVRQRTRPIKIGNRCWICNSSTITPGSFLPDFTIVASNSLVNSSINNVPENSIIGGQPAKLISTGYRRIYGSLYNRKLNEYYAESNAAFVMPDDWTMDKCSNYNF